LLVHGELHRLDGDDFDRRMSLISFDNAIEVSITTYLSLNPIQRGNRQYQKSDVALWVSNFHRKIEFLMLEVKNRGVSVAFEAGDIIWYHECRNDQYHGGKPTVPLMDELETIRKIAFWVFGVLYEHTDVEDRVGEAVLIRRPPPDHGRTAEFDSLIDDAYGICIIAGDEYRTSEVLHAFDPAAYAELGQTLKLQQVEETDELAAT
jgi:hypothetical protein